MSAVKETCYVDDNANCSVEYSNKDVINMMCPA